MAPQTERFSLLPSTDFGSALDDQMHKQAQLSPQDVQQLNQKRSDSGNAAGNKAVDNLPTVSVQSRAESGPPAATPTESRSATATPEAQMRPPTGTAAMPDDGEQNKPRDSHTWVNLGLDIPLGLAAVLAIDAIGTVAFKNPKIGFFAGETFAKYAGITEAVGTAALRTGLYAGTMTGAGALRHYGYQFLTGEQETWQDSSHHIASTVGTFMLAKRVTRFLDKSPAVVEPVPTTIPSFKPLAS